MAESSIKPIHKRRWPRYSLRTMLVIVLFMSIWLAWMANQAAKQRRAVELVQELGGSVVYECEVAGDSAAFGLAPSEEVILFLDDIDQDSLAVPEGPPSEGRLHDLLGHDWFHDVVHIVIAAPNVTNEQLEMILDGLPNIVGLHLFNSSIGDSELELIGSLERLEVVTIDGPTHVTVDGFGRLRSRRPELQVIGFAADSNPTSSDLPSESEAPK